MRTKDPSAPAVNHWQVAEVLDGKHRFPLQQGGRSSSFQPHVEHWEVGPEEAAGEYIQGEDIEYVDGTGDDLNDWDYNGFSR